jgi:hypothetical protein
LRRLRQVTIFTAIAGPMGDGLAHFCRDEAHG